MPASPDLLARVKDEPANEQLEIARLKREIALRRERVGASFEELRRRIQTATSWRHWVASHPLKWIVAGVSLGFVIGRLTGRRSRPEP